MSAIRTRGSSTCGRVAFLRKAAVVFAAVGLISSIPGTFENAASASGPTTPPFTECPAVGYNASCTLLVDVTTGGIAILKDNTATAGMPSNLVANTYDGVEDTLIGVVNNSSTSLSSGTLLHPNSEPLLRLRRRRRLPEPEELDQRFPGLRGTGSAVRRCGSTPPRYQQFVDYNNVEPRRLRRGRTPGSRTSQRLRDRRVNFITTIPPGGTSYFSLEQQPLDITDFCRPRSPRAASIHRPRSAGHRSPSPLLISTWASRPRTFRSRSP